MKQEDIIYCARTMLANYQRPIESWSDLSIAAKGVEKFCVPDGKLYNSIKYTRSEHDGSVLAVKESAAPLIHAMSLDIHLGAYAAHIDRRAWETSNLRSNTDVLEANVAVVQLIGRELKELINRAQKLKGINFAKENPELFDPVEDPSGDSDLRPPIRRLFALAKQKQGNRRRLKLPSLRTVKKVVRTGMADLNFGVEQAIEQAYKAAYKETYKRDYVEVRRRTHSHKRQQPVRFLAAISA